jgi:hypothetical protein
VTIARGLDRGKCQRKNCEGQVRRVRNWKALEVGLRAFRLADGYFAYSAAMAVASQPEAATLAPTGSPLPAGQVLRKNGTSYNFDTLYYLGEARNDRRLRDDFDRIWLTHTFLDVGHALQVAIKSTSKNEPLLRIPLLELIYHIRNGLSHGNRFSFNDYGKSRLAQYPANNHIAQIRAGGPLEINANMEGNEVLFKFAAPGDMLDILLSTSEYLKKVGIGDIGP